jgi:hypothetical protein
VRRALEEPLRQIVPNAAVRQRRGEKVARRQRAASATTPPPASTSDLVKAGVIDPTKVTRTALQNASSVAGLMLTTEAMIAEKPKKDKGRGAGAGVRGMGDMGKKAMCFSATSSLIAAAVLLPAGIYTLAIARHGDGRYGLLAAFPLLFGIQQTFEGLLWLQLAESTGPDVYGMALGSALGFLFFAYLVWPGLVPLAVWRIERDPWRRRLFGATAILGWMIGGSLFIPLLSHPDWLQVEVTRGSLLYHSQLIYDPYIAPHLGRLLYALILVLRCKNPEAVVPAQTASGLPW